MADFNALKRLIDAYIKRNGVKAITGQILNGVLNGMVNALGKGYTVAGSATPNTDPGTMTGPLAYFAYTAGTYTNFGNLEVANGEFSLLIYDEAEWHKEVLYSLAAEATVDANVGTPEVGVSFENGVLSFDFRNMKGNTGDAAGFGTVNATVDANIGTPGVVVQTSGPDTAKNITFAFRNLKGETGVTSVIATVDNTTGNPACAVSLNGQELHLDFTGLKGAQGDTGSSVDYPFTIVNNLTTNDATQALSAAMGVQLETEVSQLEAKVDYLVDSKRTFSEATNGTYYHEYPIVSGHTYEILCEGTSMSVNLTKVQSFVDAYNLGVPDAGETITFTANDNYSYVAIYKGPSRTDPSSITIKDTGDVVSLIDESADEVRNEINYIVDSGRKFTQATNGTYYSKYPFVSGRTYKMLCEGTVMSVSATKEQDQTDAVLIGVADPNTILTFAPSDNYNYICIYKGATRTDPSSVTVHDTGDIVSLIDNAIENEPNPLDEKVSSNILRLDNLVPNTYINNANGVETPYTNWSSSPYIEIEGPNTYEYLLANSQGQYSRGNSCYWACYDAGKTFIIGGATNQSTPMPVPANAKYIRVSFGNNQLSQVPMVVAQADYTQGMAYQEPSDNTYREEILATSQDIIVPKEMADSIEKIRLVCPSSFAIIQNKAMDLIYDNIVYGADATKFSFCNGGGSVTNIMRDRLRFLSTAGVTTYVGVRMQPFGALIHTTKDAPFGLYKRMDANVIPATAGSGVTKKVMFIGDSITANGKYPREVRSLFADDVMSVNLVGTLGYGGVFNGGDGKVYNSNGQVVVDGFTFNENGEVVSNATGQVVKDNSGDNMTFYHEGRGGWSAKKYCTETTYNGYVNAFWNPSSNKFDFSYYMTKYGFTGVDYVFINLGINDLMEYNNLATDADLAKIVSYYDEIIASILTYNANAKILIGLCILPANYEFSTQTNIGEHAKTCRLALHEKLIAEYEGTHLIVPLNFPIDSQRDFPSTMLPVCDRDETLVPYCTDNVHPANQGYYKIADICHTYIKYQATL